MATENKGESKLERLRREAEIEMRRNLDDSRPIKRSRKQTDSGVTTGSAGDDGGGGFVAVDRYRYAVVGELAAGAKGFVVTCNFRKEKSATREASQLLRRYMPAHLFPEPPPDSREPQPTGEQPAAAAAAAEASGAAPQQPAATQGAEAARQGADAARGAADVRRDNGAKGGGEESDGSISSDDDDGAQHGGGGGAGGAAGVAAPSEGAVHRGGDTACVRPPAEPSALGLAKVGCRGVVVMRLSEKAAAEVDPVQVLGAMLQDLDAGKLRPPMHCQRLIPFDSTCALTAEHLTRAVAAAAAAYRARQPGGAVTQPFTYAIAYRSRLTEVPPVAAAAAPPVVAAVTTAVVPTATAGAQEAARPPAELAEPPAADPGHPKSAAAANADPVPKQDAGHGRQCQPEQGQGQAQAPAPAPVPAAAESPEGGEVLSERGRIISTVAAGMAAAFGDLARVDLKKPQVAVLVESLPVAGRQFGGVSLLGQGLFLARGKLLVKPLAKNAAAS